MQHLISKFCFPPYNEADIFINLSVIAHNTSSFFIFMNPYHKNMLNVFVRIAQDLNKFVHMWRWNMKTSGFTYIKVNFCLKWRVISP